MTESGTAVLFSSPKLNGSTSFRSTEQEPRFGGMSAQGALGMQPDTELFFRRAATVNGSVTRNGQRLVGEIVPDYECKTVVGSEVVLEDTSQQGLGRGPGFQSAIW
jgi:hypothetical protein